MGAVLLATGRGVRIQTPSLLNRAQWIIEDYITRRRFAVDSVAAAVLVAGWSPTDRHELARFCSQNLGIEIDRAIEVIEALYSVGLIGQVGDSPEVDDAADWASHGWQEAYEYHLSTYDYRFLPSDDKGGEESRQRMLTYGQTEPDDNRVKVTGMQMIPMPAINPGLAPAPVGDILGRKPRSDSSVNATSLLAILPLSFGKLGNIRRPAEQWGGANALRRTSPSGGARHPTEAYVFATGVEGLDPGIYHVAVDPPGLECLRRGLEVTEVADLFPCDRAPFPVKVVVALTSVFERNMYRYREPRTFRTVHMDAGHVASTVEMLCGSFGHPCMVHYWANEIKVERAIGVHFLDEGYMLGVMIG